MLVLVLVLVPFGLSPVSFHDLQSMIRSVVFCSQRDERKGVNCIVTDIQVITTVCHPQSALMNAAR